MKAFIISSIILLLVIGSLIAGVFAQQPGLLLVYLCAAPFAGGAFALGTARAVRGGKPVLLNDDERLMLQQMRSSK